MIQKYVFDSEACEPKTLLEFELETPLSMENTHNQIAQSLAENQNLTIDFIYGFAYRWGLHPNAVWQCLMSSKGDLSTRQ